MLKKRLACLFLISLFVTACGPVYKTTYTYVPPKKSRGKICAVQCQQSKNLCSRTCNSDYENCKNRAMNEARFKYEEYVSKRRSQHLEIEKDLNYFYSPYSCTKRSCGCNEDYRSCFQMCGGEVIPNKTCVAFCGK